MYIWSQNVSVGLVPDINNWDWDSSQRAFFAVWEWSKRAIGTSSHNLSFIFGPWLSLSLVVVGVWLTCYVRSSFKLYFLFENQIINKCDKSDVADLTIIYNLIIGNCSNSQPSTNINQFILVLYLCLKQRIVLTILR